MGRLWYELTTRRPQEKNVGYCECHDQALVGDKTLIFRMADAEMYTGMDKAYHSPAIDRAIALHKMIRFITLALGSEAYLNFMGNEFGHPEWIDFPREGNGWSHQLRPPPVVAGGKRLSEIRMAGALRPGRCCKFARKYRVMTKPAAANLWMDEENKLLAFAKGDLIYLFNFSPDASPTDFFVPAHITGEGQYRADVHHRPHRIRRSGSRQRALCLHRQARPGQGRGLYGLSPQPHGHRVQARGLKEALMQQLMMYRPAGAPRFCPEWPEGYSVSRYRGPEDIPSWLECCKNGLIPEDAGTDVFFEAILDCPDVRMDEDVLFLDHDGRHVGTVTAVLHPDGSWGEMHMVGLQSAFRGRGLSALLNRMCIEKLEAQNARFIELTTDEWRRAAVRSYLRAGFLPVDSDSDMVERWTALLREMGISSVPMLNRECQTVRTL